MFTQTTLATETKKEETETLAIPEKLLVEAEKEKLDLEFKALSTDHIKSPVFIRYITDDLKIRTRK